MVSSALMEFHWSKRWKDTLFLLFCFLGSTFRAFLNMLWSFVQPFIRCLNSNYAEDNLMWKKTKARFNFQLVEWFEAELYVHQYWHDVLFGRYWWQHRRRITGGPLLPVKLCDHLAASFMLARLNWWNSNVTCWVIVLWWFMNLI